MLKVRRAALICRTSTVSQSNLRQVEELAQLASVKGYTIDSDDVYEDQISGFSKHEKRPALFRLLENIRTKKKTYDMVFSLEVSRISRDPDEGQKILMQLNEFNVPVYIKNISMCTHLDGEFDRHGKLKRNPLFGIVFKLLSEFAAAEAEYIRERSISGIRSHIKKGGASPGPNILYGYKRDENRMMVIDEEEAQVVREMFDYAAKGYGLNTIAKILNDAGIPTKSQNTIKKGTIVTTGSGGIKRVKKTEHIKWSPGTIQKKLTDTAYKGERVIKVDEKFVDGKKVEINDVIPVEPIVSVELWNKVNKLRSNKYNNRSAEMRYMYLLKGICQCGVCGRWMAGRYKPGLNGPTDAYYQCSSKRTTEKCNNTSPNIEALESVVWDVVKNSNKLFEHMKSTGTKMKDANEKMNRLRDEQQYLEKTTTDLEKEKEKLKLMLRKDVLTEEEFDTDWDKLKKQIDNTNHQLKRVRNQIIAVAELRVLLSNLDVYINMIKSVQNNRFRVAEILNNVVEKVVVTSVNRRVNNYSYIISIWVRDIEPPITVLMETKQRNLTKGFIPDSTAKETGHNRFRYINAGMLDQRYVSYQNDILLTPVEDVVEAIKTVMPSVDETPLDFSGYDATEGFIAYDCHVVLDNKIVYYVPELLPFEEKNAIDEVQVIKKKQKQKTSG